MGFRNISCDAYEKIHIFQQCTLTLDIFQTSFGWFGGGMDVTPSIINKKEKKWIHNELKKTCKIYNKDYYKKYKKWCDEYFYLPHRKEMRGIGGIFFDYKK